MVHGLLVWGKLKNENKYIYTLIIGLKFEEETSEVLRLGMALYGAETWTLRATDQKHLESIEMWRWRRMEKIIWTDHVRNKEVLLRVKEQRNILR